MPVSEATERKSPISVEAMNSDDLLVATRRLAIRARVVEAHLISHLAEIDARKLYRDRAFSSMFSFCVRELGFSGDVAYNRILVARAGRRWPAVMEALRLGRVHLAGLRLLAPHLTDENHAEVLAQANGKSKRRVEELVARLAPRPPVPTFMRQLPDPSAMQAALGTLATPNGAIALAAASSAARRSIVEPLSETTFKIEFTGSRALKDKLCEAQDLLRHRIPDGDLATVIERAVDLLIEKVKKQRFALAQRPRKKLADTSTTAKSRYIPAAVRRTVLVRDEGRCTFVDETTGRRCEETSGLEFDHFEGYERTKRHDARCIRLLCRSHHRLVTEKTYGIAFQERAIMARQTSSLLVPGRVPNPVLVRGAALPVRDPAPPRWRARE
jgi:hypothetical protein